MLVKADFVLYYGREKTPPHTRLRPKEHVGCFRNAEEDLGAVIKGPSSACKELLCRVC